MTLQSIIENVKWNKKIEILRAAKGWSQEEAAKACGTTRKNYYLWEAGKTYPRLNSRKAIANGFKVKITEIFKQEQEESS